MANSKKKDERVRNWTFILYPESAPTNWLELLKSYHIPFCVSPLHDKDINPDGTNKKEHYHILFKFPNKMSYKQVLSLTCALKCPNPQKCQNLVGMVRYFAHIDNPEKFTYDISDIKGYCGFDVENYLLTDSEKEQERYSKISEMMNFVIDNDITEMEDLFVYAMNNRENKWFELLCSNSAYVMNIFLKSRRHRKDRNE